MAVSKKVRVYDLAREVKQDTKRIIEELKREGADVSVPSNSVAKELADKIRNKYFPKVDKAPKRIIKVIKKKAVKKKTVKKKAVKKKINWILPASHKEIIFLTSIITIKTTPIKFKKSNNLLK